jgi:hypothetical protein
VARIGKQRRRIRPQASRRFTGHKQQIQDNSPAKSAAKLRWWRMVMVMMVVSVVVVAHISSEELAMKNKQ